MAQTPKMEMHPNFAKAFGVHTPAGKSPVKPMNEEEGSPMMHHELPGAPAGSGIPTQGLHPKLQILMNKLSPTQEQEPEEEGQFSPGRLEAGMQ